MSAIAKSVANEATLLAAVLPASLVTAYNDGTVATVRTAAKAAVLAANTAAGVSDAAFDLAVAKAVVALALLDHLNDGRATKIIDSMLVL